MNRSSILPSAVLLSLSLSIFDSLLNTAEYPVHSPLAGTYYEMLHIMSLTHLLIVGTVNSVIFFIITRNHLVSMVTCISKCRDYFRATTVSTLFVTGHRNFFLFYLSFLNEHKIKW